MASPVCPKCGSALKDEYGMQQCPGCGAFNFVDMDGNASVQVDEPPSEVGDATPIEDQPVDHADPGGAAAPPEFNDPIENIIDVPVDESSDVLVGEPVSNLDQLPEFDSPFDQPAQDFAPISFDVPGADADGGSVPESSAPKAAPDAAVAAGTAQPAAVRTKAEPSFGPADDPLNLNEFANSEVSSAKDGPLLFRVLISGIDTKEIRESIREVLEDSRFAWDSHAIFAKVSKGNLVINGLSPVKASILITRIKRLPVQIRWEQYAISQGQPDA